MSDSTLKRLAEDRLSFLKGIDLVKPNPPEKKGNGTDGLPPPAEQKDVDEIKQNATDTKIFLDYAREQLQSRMF